MFILDLGVNGSSPKVQADKKPEVKKRTIVNNDDGSRTVTIEKADGVVITKQIPAKVVAANKAEKDKDTFTPSGADGTKSTESKNGILDTLKSIIESIKTPSIEKTEVEAYWHEQHKSIVKDFNELSVGGR